MLPCGAAPARLGRRALLRRAAHHPARWRAQLAWTASSFPLAVSDVCVHTSPHLLPPGIRLQATGQYLGASHTPPQRGARPSRQPFSERPVKTATCPPARERGGGERENPIQSLCCWHVMLASLLTCCGDQVPQSSSSGQNRNLAGTTDAPRRKGLRALNPSRDASKPSMMR